MWDNLSVKPRLCRCDRSLTSFFHKRSLKPGPHRTRQRSSGPVCHRPSASRPVGPFGPVKTSPGAAGGGFDRTERVVTRSDGRKQVRNSADGCGEDRASLCACLTPQVAGSRSVTAADVTTLGRAVPLPLLSLCRRGPAVLRTLCVVLDRSPSSPSPTRTLSSESEARPHGLCPPSQRLAHTDSVLRVRGSPTRTLSSESEALPHGLCPPSQRLCHTDSVLRVRGSPTRTLSSESEARPHGLCPPSQRLSHTDSVLRVRDSATRTLSPESETLPHGLCPPSHPLGLCPPSQRLSHTDSAL